MIAIEFNNTLLLLGSALIIAGILSSVVSTRFGLPILLVFLSLGMLAGVDGPGGLRFSDYQLTELVGVTAITVILFDGGLRTRLSHFRGVVGPAAVLATFGVVITAALCGALAGYLFGLGPRESFLIGAIVGSTDAAAVFFLLRTGGVQLKRKVATLLEIESGTNDPVAVFLTLATVALIASGQQMPDWHNLIDLFQQAVIGGLAGLFGGFVLVGVLNTVNLPTGLHPLLAITGAIAIYGAASLGGGSGFFAVYLAGMIVGNLPVRAYASITSLLDAATWLAQLAMFLVLGLLASPHRLLGPALPALGIALFLVFVARPVAVFICLQFFRFSFREKLFVSWVGLRGAVSIFLAIIPTLAGLRHAALYFDIAFFVVIVSLILQGGGMKWMAIKLQQVLPRLIHPVERVELDLPGQLDLEMVGYPIGPDSRALGVSTLPDWARRVLVVRGNEVLESHEAGDFQAGDYAYFLAPPLRVNRLDRLFASTGERYLLDALDTEFPIRGDAPIAKLNELYGLNCEIQDETQTVAGMFAERFETTPDIGDTLPFGGCILVVRSLNGDEVSRAGLQLMDVETSPLGAMRGRTRKFFSAVLRVLGARPG